MAHLKITMFRFATALLVALATTSVGARDATSSLRSSKTLQGQVERKLQTTTIVDLAIATPALSTLVTAVSTAG
jgi:hypothetical protein